MIRTSPLPGQPLPNDPELNRLADSIRFGANDVGSFVEIRKVEFRREVSRPVGFQIREILYDTSQHVVDRDANDTSTRDLDRKLTRNTCWIWNHRQLQTSN